MALLENIRKPFRRGESSPINDGVEPFADDARWTALASGVKLDPVTKVVKLPAEIEREIQRSLDDDPEVQRRRRALAG